MISEIIDLPDIQTKLVRLVATTSEEEANLRRTSEDIKLTSVVIPVYIPESNTLTIALKYEKEPSQATSTTQEIPIC
jgi:hypothetical protein